jgi:hypothetical protein
VDVGVGAEEVADAGVGELSLNVGRQSAGKGTSVTGGSGRLVVWCPKASPADSEVKAR